jgi:MFS family permease
MTLRQERSPWSDKYFRTFAACHFVDCIGGSVYSFAMPLLALSYTGSLATMALIVAVTPLIIAISGPPLGHVVDRYGSRVLVVPGLIVQLAASVGFNVILLFGEAPVWTLYLAEILVQAGAVCYRAGAGAAVSVLFRQTPGRARGSLFMLAQATFVLGPALAAMLVGTVGFLGLLWLNTLTFVAPLLLWNSARTRCAASAQHRNVSFRRDSALAGVRMFMRDPKLQTLLTVMVPMSLVFSTAATTLVVYWCTTHLGASMAEVGVALAVANVGALIGAVAGAEIRRWRTRALMFASLLGTMVCLLVIAGGPGLLWVTIAFAVFLLCDNVLSVLSEMEIFSAVAPETIGRVSGAWRLFIGVPSFVAPIAVAGLADSLTPPHFFVGFSAVSAAVFGWLILRRTVIG